MTGPWRRKPGRSIYPSEVLLAKGVGGLAEDSLVLARQARSISKRRLPQPIGTLDDDRLRSEVVEAIKEHLALDYRALHRWLTRVMGKPSQVNLKAGRSANKIFVTRPVRNLTPSPFPGKEGVGRETGSPTWILGGNAWRRTGWFNQRLGMTGGALDERRTRQERSEFSNLRKAP